MIIKRTLKLLSYLVISSFIIYVLVEKTAGNPAILYLQRHGYTTITQEHIELAEHKLGLGQNIFLRYIDWLGHALTGHLGYTFSSNEPVTDVILASLSPTLVLISVSACILLLFGYSIGYIIGSHAETKYARVIRGFAQVMTSMPEYWIAILLIYYAGVRWRFVPFVGSDTWQHFLLPIITIVIIEGCHVLLMTAHLIEQTLESDEIAVQAICDEAMVHRTTFYAHFEDKYHLLSSCLDYIIEHEAVFTDITLSPEKCLKELIKIVDKYKDAFSQVISNKKASIQNILKKNMSEGIKQHIKESGHIYDSTHIDIIIAAYVASVLSILENYVAEDVEINEKDLDNILNTLSRMFAS